MTSPLLGVRFPALAPACAVLGGIALGLACPPGRASGLAGALAGLVAVGLHWRRPRLALALGLIALVALGAWRGGSARGQALQRTTRLEAPSGGPREVELTGRLLAAPARGLRGERRLAVLGYARPPLGGPGPGPLRVELTVAASPPEATAPLDALRRGDRVRVWSRLRLPRRPGNPGAPDPVTAMRGAGWDARGRVKSARLVERLVPGPRGRVDALVDRVRVAGRGRLDRSFGTTGEVRAVLGAMLLGDRAGVEPELRRRFRDAGLGHLLAISGLHVGIVACLLLGLLGRAPGPAWRLDALAGIPLLLLLAPLVGGRVPVARAVGAAALMLGGDAVGRRGRALNTLAVVAAVLALAHPWSVRGAAFQLSFVATAGILTLGDRRRWRLALPAPLGSAVAVSAAAYAATAPIAAWHFGRLAPVAVAANLLAVPLCGAVLLAGGTVLGTAVLPGDTDAGSGAAARVAVSALLATVDAAAAIPGGSRGVPRPGPVLLALHALFLTALARHRFRNGAAIAARVAGTCAWVTLVLLHLGPPPGAPRAAVEALVADVGQGQAVILRGPGGGCLLADAGGSAGGRFDAGERIVAPLLRREGCRRLAALVVSHEDDDHAGGAPAIVDGFDVDELWLAPGFSHRPRLAALAERARRRGIAVVSAGRGRRSSRAGIPLAVLHPGEHDASRRANDRSIVLLAGRAPNRLLIPGDLERAGEARVLARAAPVAAEALVAGHHGARASSGGTWLDAVRPRVALVSAGAGNRFGHPHPELLTRLERRGVTVLRTDRHGLLRLTAGQAGWTWSTGLRTTTAAAGSE